MKQLEAFITSSQQASPRPEFVEQAWTKTAQAYNRQLGGFSVAGAPSIARLQFFKSRWFLGLPVAIAFALVVMVGVRQKMIAPPTPNSAQELTHDDSLDSLDSDMAKLEAHILYDPVIDEVLNN